jgi:hypothetical protein
LYTDLFANRPWHRAGRQRLDAAAPGRFENAFAKVGGEKYLVRIAKENLAIFRQLLIRVVAKQLEHSVPVTIDRPVSRLEGARRVAFLLHTAALELEKQKAEQKNEVGKATAQ